MIYIGINVEKLLQIFDEFAIGFKVISVSLVVVLLIWGISEKIVGNKKKVKREEEKKN